ncbi:class I SAM-dependent methyltransferase [Nocardia sp. NPDC051990]|uniref:class I SAM-dependent methyltransferase n=1 Tax=Nocardia sp. NPDC051990 TaxID=3155285 RepID=UPI003440FC5A
MQPITVDVMGSQATAFLTLYLRWRDAEDRHSLLKDTWAATVMGNLDFDFTQFRNDAYARFFVAARSRLLDEWVRRFLADNPDAIVLDLGSGFDSRVFRIDPGFGHLWYDVDFPTLIEARNRLYPERPGYFAVGASVTDPDWLEQIPGDRPVIAVADSLLMFLTPDQVRTTFRQVIDHFPRGEFVFTAYSSKTKKNKRKTDYRPFFRKYGIQLDWTLDDLSELARIDTRLQCLDRRSQADPRLQRATPLWNKLLCVLVYAIPAYRYSAATLRCRF